MWMQLDADLPRKDHTFARNLTDTIFVSLMGFIGGALLGATFPLSVPLVVRTYQGSQPMKKRHD